VLWVFGIAAALFSGGVGGAPGGGQGFRYTISGEDIERWRRGMPWMPGMPFQPWGWMEIPAWESIVPVIVGIVGVFVVVMLVIAIVGIIVRYTSLGALIGMVGEVEETDETHFQSGLRIGWRRFLRLLVIDLLIGIVLALVIVVFIVLLIIGGLMAAAPIALFADRGGGMVALGILIAVAIGLGLLLFMILVGMALSAVTTLIREYAYRACVLDMKGIFDALGAGITMMSTQFRESLLMWLLLLAINIALGLVSIPLAVLGGVGLVGPAIAVYSATRSIVAAVVAALPVLLVIFIVATLLSGVYLTWRSAVWTLTYRELRGREPLAETALTEAG